ncbi:trypco2 family protein [Kitasatospora phosalacinea]|uniref:Trypsin-co-occurring domain-containing protein n=1 Tax=Kitasatospora phosalacinea TaxID=2065 RepID=A0A9W6PL61_9ACTN|nr:trypco2 family protein [Kitasatospora phosalacinea]GLW56882.1 hypothetical protein Kpho01_48930 [Kitasatospora phosalacinea]
MRAQHRGAGQETVFEVGPIEMEFEVELRADATAGGKSKVWALSAEAAGSVSRDTTHRISFTLQPRRADRTDLRISGSPDLRRGRPRARAGGPHRPLRELSRDRARAAETQGGGARAVAARRGTRPGGRWRGRIG